MPVSVHLDLVNADFDASISMTDFAFESAYVLELTPERFTALMKLSVADVIQTNSIYRTLQQQAAVTPESKAPVSSKAVFTQQIKQWRGIEVFVLEGTCSIEGELHHQGSYIRLPLLKDDSITAMNDCILFIKLNQFLDGDTGIRTIETRVPDKWLPGPVDGIEIRPLHVFDTESIMLLRWHHAAEFRPKLNPRGEEILVINGLLQNRDHLYRQYSWIRNPIEDWRKWHGNTGTMAYYKSGHFPDDPARL